MVRENQCGKGTGKSVWFDSTVAPIGDHAVPWRSKLNGSVEHVKVFIPGMLNMQKAKCDSIGRPFFPVNPPFTVVAVANFIRYSKHDVDHAAVSAPSRVYP